MTCVAMKFVDDDDDDDDDFASVLTKLIPFERVFIAFWRVSLIVQLYSMQEYNYLTNSQYFCITGKT